MPPFEMEKKAFIFDNTVFIRYIPRSFCKNSTCNLMYWLLFLKNHVVYLAIWEVTVPPWTVTGKAHQSADVYLLTISRFLSEGTRKRRLIRRRHLIVATTLDVGVRSQNSKPQLFHLKVGGRGKIVDSNGSPPELYNEIVCWAFSHLGHTSEILVQ